MRDEERVPLNVKSPSEAEEKGQREPAELVAAVAREMAEPRDGVAPTPVTILLLFFVLAGWGGYYIASESGGFRADVYDENFVEGAGAAEPPKAEDPMVLGRRTFNVCTQRIRKPEPEFRVFTLRSTGLKSSLETKQPWSASSFMD